MLNPWFEVREQAASGRLFLRDACALDHAHDVGLLHDQKVLAVDLDLGAGPFAEQHPVARFEFEWDQLAALVTGSRPDGDDLALLRLLLDGVRNNDAAFRLILPSMRRMTTRSCNGRNLMGLAPGLTSDAGLTRTCAGVRLGS
jgi:hypothetical protein